MSKYLLRSDLRIDELFRDAIHSVGISSVGRMSPSTAIYFVLVGISLFVSRRSFELFEIFVLSGLTAALIWNYFGMKMNATVGFFLQGIGLLALVKSEGMKWSLSKSSTGGSIFCIELMVALVEVAGLHLPTARCSRLDPPHPSVFKACFRRAQCH
jgi:hypothetical protein